MIDGPAAIRAMLVADATVLSTATGGIYAERDVPPEGYSPATSGPAVVFRTRGGRPDYEADMILPSVQIKTYGKDEVEANALYRAVYDAIHHRRRGNVAWAEVETIGTTLREPEVLWPFVLFFASFTLRE